MKRVRKGVVILAVTALCAGWLYGVPQVSDVTCEQREGTRVIDISYNLAGDGIVTLSIETNGVSIGDQFVTHLAGDVNKVVEGGTGKKIIWNAGFDWPEMEVEVQARVTVWSEDAPPLYCAVDVTDGYSAGAGEYPIYYYPSEAGVPGGTSNHIYKTVQILMRRIEPTSGSGFMMGSPPNESGRNANRETQVKVHLSKPYYIGVYQITQQQWQQVCGNERSWPSYWNNNDYRLTRPVEQVSYFDIREDISANSAISPNWPASDAVHENSFMGRMRTRTGLATFDLPTEAQWEWACRAGTTGALNDGSANVSNTTICAYLDQLGRYERNGGKVLNESGSYVDPATGCTTDNATAAVGSYQPNAWGLYDMHGNVWEWCLDWYADAKGGGEDPAGAVSGSNRVRRGGSWNSPASHCRSAYRFNGTPSSRLFNIGFRLLRTLP